MKTSARDGTRLLLHPFHFFRPVLRAQTVSGAHHDGCRAARNLYGVIIAPVVLITAGGQAPGPFETAIVLSVTVGVVLSMET